MLFLSNFSGNPNGAMPTSVREGSPGSDDSGSTSSCSSSGVTMATASSINSASTGGNLVQKQIERLYGGRERSVPVRLTHQSSSPGSSSTSTSPQPSKDELDKSFERQHYLEEPCPGQFILLF